MKQGDEAKFSIIDKIRNHWIFKYFEKHTALVIAIVSLVVTVGSFAIRLFEYLILKGRLSIYNLPTEYIKMDSYDSITNFINRALIFICVFIASAYGFKLFDFLKSTFSIQKEIILIKDFKHFTRFKKILSNLFLTSVGLLAELIMIELLNIGIFYLVTIPKYIVVFSWQQFFIETGQLLFMEILVVFITKMLQWFDNISKKRKIGKESTIEVGSEKLNENNEKTIQGKEKINLVNTLTSFIVILIFSYIIIVYTLGLSTGYILKTYDLTADNAYAIVYRVDNKCILVSAKVANDQLVLDTTKQKVISDIDVEYNQMTFKTVTINYD